MMLSIVDRVSNIKKKNVAVGWLVNRYPTSCDVFLLY